MIENLKNLNDRDIKLSKFSKKDLDQLYLRVFSSADGELVMQDMANRCYVYDTSAQGEDYANYSKEGMRAAWLSIQTRLRDAVAPK